ncbi:Ger(x)C family spore germination protein [Neobacillus sp. NRS-1170]|uniref:Ger(x)C family spore germination protein n=1 Tax=Neobacillus sp. NRS-1170 TaxID=3233898 RepID=UPI003D29DD4B
MTKQLQIGIIFFNIHLSFGYLVYPNLLYAVAKTGHWEMVLCQGLLQLILIWIYMKGLDYFPNNDVIAILLNMGRWAAIIFLTPYVINLVALVAFNIRLHTEVIISIFLPRTPYWSIMILFFFISVYTAIKGLGTILRSSILIFMFVFPLVLTNIFSSVINFDLHNVVPGWHLPHKFMLNSKFVYLLGFSSFLFLGFIPSNKTGTFRHLLVACVSVTLFFLSVVYIPLFIFGQETVVTLPHPFVEAMDTVDISWFSFNRQTMFFGISLVGLVILANAILLWMVGRIMRKMINYRIMKSSYWIIAFAVIAFILALFVPNKALIEKCFLWSIGAQTYSMILIPLTILIYGFFSKRGVLGYKNKKRYKQWIVILSIIFLGGCWDIKDINKRSLPLVMGISKENGKEFKVTLQIPILKNESQISRIVTGKGETVPSVLGELRTNSEDAIDYSQIRLIVIQNKLAQNQEEFKKLIKFFMGSEDIPSRAIVAITDDNVENVLSNINDKLGVHASSIHDYFNKGAGWAPEVFSTPIWEVYRSPFLYTKDIAVPVVRSGKDTVLIFEGADILKQGKLMDRISPDDSQLINVFQNKNEKGKIRKLDFASIMVTNSSIKNKASMKNYKPMVSSELNLKIHILERNEGITNKRIQNELEKLAEKRFYQILKKTQGTHTDIFGFGQEFHHLISYNELKNWRNEYYPKLKVNFQVHARME